MLCIAYICRCFFSPPHDVSKDVDFERECYLTINPVENCIYWAYAEVFDVRISDDYFGIIDGYLVLFDEKRFFISCSKCLVEVKSRVRQLKQFEDGRHDQCFYQFESYLDERLTREIRGEYIYHIRGLCKECVFEYFNNIKGELITCFHLYVCDCQS